ncbi:MAG: DUF1840 family protein [Burkholderiaceae bacterium]
MTYTFKSRATGSVTMNHDLAEQVMHAIGHEPGPTGVITVAQMQAAIYAISNMGTPDDAASVAAHTSPLLDMLRRSLAAGKDVTWGV